MPQSAKPKSEGPKAAGSEAKEGEKPTEVSKEPPKLQANAASSGISSQATVTPKSRKTKEAKTLQSLAETEKQVKGLSQVNVAEAVRQSHFDIQIVSARTIEGLLEFLGLQTEANLYELDKNLFQKRIDI